MAEPISIQQLKDASLDVKSLEEVINGDENVVVTTRLGETYPSIKGSIKKVFANGGLPAVPFNNKTLMMESLLSNGQYAMVTDDTDNNGLYIKIEGSWIKSSYDTLGQAKVYTNSALSSRIYDVDGTEDIFAFSDASGAIGVTIDSGANINANNIDSTKDLGVAWAVLDEGGNAAILVDNSGNFDSAVTRELKADILELQQNGIGQKNNPFAPLSLPKSDLMHIFSYGQSLSRGTNANPAISTTQPYSNLTFASGVLPKADVAHDYTSFKPLIEQNMAGSESETPTSGMLNAFVGLQVALGDAAEKWKMIGTAPGQEGRTIAQLSKGTANYAGMLTQVQAAYDIAQAQGKTYSVWAMAWTQGENDYAGVGTTQASYLTALLKLRDDFNTDVKAITNQSFDVPVVMYQTAAHRHTNYLKNTMQIALAQLQAANEYKNIVMACPIYHLPHASDNIHLTSDSSQQLGRYYAKALDYSLNNIEKWQPLQPVNILRQGKIVDIEFNKSNLVIDTTLVAATHNMGFDLWSGNTLLDIITSVTVTDSNRVRILMSAVPPAGVILSYARGRDGDPQAAGNIVGARGNLRDSAGVTDNYTDSSGVTRYMHNWCVMFEKTI